MMGTWESFTQGQKALAEKVFDALSSLDEVTRPREEGATAAETVGFADLFAYATEPDSVMDDPLQRALAESPRLRDDLDHLLSRNAIYRFPRAAAASSGAVESREGEGFRIQLRASRAVESQVYVIIELADQSAEPPKTIHLAEPEDRYSKYALPEAQGGTIQMLVEADSPLVAALRDVHTDVYLR
jgi:hypothetical protein